MEALLKKIYNIVDKWRLQTLQGIESYNEVPTSVQTLVYYTDTDGGNNPSGSTTNLKHIIYTRPNSKSFYQEIWYNSDDCIVKKEVFAGEPS
jgi:hypothetical protein